MVNKFRALTVLIGLSLIGCSMLSIKKTDDYYYKRAVKLFSERGSCSGEQVRAASGIDYILTAGHCKVLVSPATQSVMVETEDGGHLERRLVAEDSESDLLLFEGLPNLEGLRIARNAYKKEHVTTYTHGSGFDSYATGGNLVQNKEIFIEAENCDKSMPKYKSFGDACALVVVQTVSTARAVPGSSGGMALNDDGELIGVVSATDNSFLFSYLVRLQDIKRFLSTY